METSVKPLFLLAKEGEDYSDHHHIHIALYDNLDQAVIELLNRVKACKKRDIRFYHIRVVYPNILLEKYTYYHLVRTKEKSQRERSSLRYSIYRKLKLIKSDDVTPANLSDPASRAVFDVYLQSVSEMFFRKYPDPSLDPRCFVNVMRQQLVDFPLNIDSNFSAYDDFPPIVEYNNSVE